MKASASLKDLTIDELRQKEQQMRKELFNLRFQHSRGEVENPKRMRTVRKDLARALTFITGKSKGPKEG